jgi:hypothetical protein
VSGQEAEPCCGRNWRIAKKLPELPTFLADQHFDAAEFTDAEAIKAVA